MGIAAWWHRRREAIVANLDEAWLWPSYPQKLWITLFMKLGDQAVSRANTGLQGLFKKYLQKIVSLKIK